MHPTAQFGEQLAHRRDDCAGAAHRIMNPPFAFEVVDHGVDRRRVERVTADQQRMEGEALAQKVVFDELRQIAVDAAVRLHLDQVGRDFEHVGEVQKRLIRQLDETLLEDRFRRSHKLLIAGFVGGIPLFDLAEDEVLVTVVIEAAPVVIEDAVVRVAGDQVEVVFAALARRCEQIVEHERRGDHRRTAVELEAIDLVDVSPPAELVALLEQLDVVPFGGKANGGGETAEAAADHDNSGHAYFLCDR